jgi:hypothetical protein
MAPRPTSPQQGECGRDDDRCHDMGDGTGRHCPGAPAVFPISGAQGPDRNGPSFARPPRTSRDCAARQPSPDKTLLARPRRLSRNTSHARSRLLVSPATPIDPTSLLEWLHALPKASRGSQPAVRIDGARTLQLADILPSRSPSDLNNLHRQTLPIKERPSATQLPKERMAFDRR